MHTTPQAISMLASSIKRFTTPLRLDSMFHALSISKRLKRVTTANLHLLQRLVKSIRNSSTMVLLKIMQVIIGLPRSIKPTTVRIMAIMASSDWLRKRRMALILSIPIGLVLRYQFTETCLGDIAYCPLKNNIAF